MPHTDIPSVNYKVLGVIFPTSVWFGVQEQLLTSAYLQLYYAAQEAGGEVFDWARDLDTSNKR